MTRSVQTLTRSFLSQTVFRDHAFISKGLGLIKLCSDYIKFKVKKRDFNLMEARLAKNPKPRPAFLPHPPAGRKPKSRRISKTLASVLRILPPAKLFRKTESIFS